jgi:hypothetical protein
MTILASTNLSGLSKVASAEYLLALADRNPLVSHPAFFYLGDRLAEGSVTQALSEYDLMGTSLPQPIAEGASVGDTSIGRVEYSVTVGRYSKAYSMTDLAKMVDNHGILQTSALAADAALSGALRLTQLVAALGSGWTAVRGSSGAVLTLADFLAAKNLLEQEKNAGPLVAILKPKQWQEVVSNVALTLTSGSIIRDPSTLDPLQQFGIGYQGRFYGVDVITSDYVPNDGTDFAGQMIAPGAVLWADGQPIPDGSDQMIMANKVLFERDRTARAATTAYVSHLYLGVSRGLQARGVRIRSKVAV